MKKPILSGFVPLVLALSLAGCASKPEAQPAVVVPPVQAPVPEEIPEPTDETRNVQGLVQKWRAMGLNAFAQYQSTAKTIHWTLLRTTLPTHPLKDEEVVKEAARFAKQAGKPVQLLLITSNRKDDTRLSQAIRNAAQQSGGNNSIKFDHLIEAQAQTMIQLQMRDVK